VDINKNTNGNPPVIFPNRYSERLMNKKTIIALNIIDIRDVGEGSYRFLGAVWKLNIGFNSGEVILKYVFDKSSVSLSSQPRRSFTLNNSSLFNNKILN
jgi:hypothetical protein